MADFVAERSADGELDEADEIDLLNEIGEYKEQAELSFTEVLLPHQTVQIKQAAFAKRFKIGILNFFNLPQVKKELGISEGQLKKFDKIQSTLAKEKRDLEIEYRKKIKDLVEASKKETYEVLTGVQKGNFEKLTGLLIDSSKNLELFRLSPETSPKL